jgi:hypothetical protein
VKGLGVACCVLAIGGYASASAMAELVPERGTCKAKAGGIYKDNLCLEEGGTSKGHEFEWEPLEKTATLTLKSGEATLKAFTPEGAELPAVTCNKSKGKGKLLSSTTSESTVTFEECSSSGEKCTGGAKAKAGEIVTFALDGTLGVIPGGSGVGEMLVGGGPGGLLAEFKCGADEIKTDGAVVAEVTPVASKAASTETVALKATGSTQEFETFDGETGVHLALEADGLGGGKFPFKATETSTSTAKAAPLEIRLAKEKIWFVNKVALAQGATRNLAAAAAIASFVLEGTVKNGVTDIQVKCTGVQAAGKVIGKKELAAQLEFNGCTLPENCVIQEVGKGGGGAGTLTFQKLEGKLSGDVVTFKEAVLNKPIAEFELVKCSKTARNATYNLTGTFPAELRFPEAAQEEKRFQLTPGTLMLTNLNSKTSSAVKLTGELRLQLEPVVVGEKPVWAVGDE